MLGKGGVLNPKGHPAGAVWFWGAARSWACLASGEKGGLESGSESTSLRLCFAITLFSFRGSRSRLTMWLPNAPRHPWVLPKGPGWLGGAGAGRQGSVLGKTKKGP